MVRRSAALFPFSLLDELVRGSTVLGERLSGPPVEVFSGESGLRLRAALPGIDPASLDVALEDQVLRIRAKAQAAAPQAARALSRELPIGERGDVDLALRLGFRPDRAALRATYEAGVLSLELPRASEELPHKITVEAR